MEPESAESYYARIAATLDDDGRLPLNTEGMPSWDIFPFEPGSLRIKPLRPLDEAERIREDDDPADCWCASPQNTRSDRVIWHNDRWLLEHASSTTLPVQLFLLPRQHHDLPGLPAELAAEMGQLLVSITAAMEALPSVGRAHVAKYGEVRTHLHLFFFGRPARMSQLHGTPLPDWAAHLPQTPPEVHRANAAYVAGRVAVDMGGVAVTAAF